MLTLTFSGTAGKLTNMYAVCVIVHPVDRNYSYTNQKEVGSS